MATTPKFRGILKATEMYQKGANKEAVKAPTSGRAEARTSGRLDEQTGAREDVLPCGQLGKRTNQAHVQTCGRADVLGFEFKKSPFLVQGPPHFLHKYASLP